MSVVGVGAQARDAAFEAMDWRFRLALRGLGPAYHWLSYGQAYEASVCDEIAKLLPPSCVIDGALLDVPDHEADGKQVDFVVRFPHARLFGEGAATLVSARGMLVAGEVKTNLSKRQDILETARRLATAASREGVSRLAFAVVAGTVERVSTENLIREISDIHPVLWPAAFVLGKAEPASGGHPAIATTSAYSVFAVDGTSPLRMMDEEQATCGVVRVESPVMSPSGLLYLWLWAALNERGALPSWDYSLMHAAVADFTTRDPIIATVHSGSTKAQRALSFELGTPTAIRPEALVVAREEPVVSSAPLPTAGSVESSAQRRAEGTRRVILIKLGDWVDEPVEWDESPWGGGLERRSGHGYYEGIGRRELLDAARVFWRFNPDAPTWRDIEYAVVAHGGRVRAVLRIDRFIGPLWGRYGFQGGVVDDAEIVAELVGREVPNRMNPMTTVVL